MLETAEEDRIELLNKRTETRDKCCSLEVIGSMAFGSCTSLQSIKIPSTVRVIGGEAFCDCTQLIHVELCEGLKVIVSIAFGSCT